MVKKNTERSETLLPQIYQYGFITKELIPVQYNGVQLDSYFS